MRTVEINTVEKTYRFIMDSKEAVEFYFEFIGTFSNRPFLGHAVLRVMVFDIDDAPSAKFCWIRGRGQTIRNGATFLEEKNNNPTFEEYNKAKDYSKEYLDAQK